MDGGVMIPRSPAAGYDVIVVKRTIFAIKDDIERSPVRETWLDGAIFEPSANFGARC